MSIGILPNVNSKKTNRDVRQGISVCSRIIGLTNNRIKSRKRAIIHKRRESDGKNAVAVVRIESQMSYVSQAGLGVIGYSKCQTSPEKNAAKSLGTDSKNMIHSVYGYVKQVPGKRKGHRLEKYKSKILISEVVLL